LRTWGPGWRERKLEGFREGLSGIYRCLNR
jgi:hypothetical protein